jgi:hypothetical protein
VSEFAGKFFVDSMKTQEGQVIGYQYFRSRGLTDETIAKYGLGWAPAQSRTALADAARALGYKEEYLLDTGLCKQYDDGRIGYSAALGFTPDSVSFGEHAVSAHVKYIKSHDAYACAYMYVRSFDIRDKYQRELYRAFEMALINNASAGGADDILLILPKITDANIDEIERYVSDASKASTGASVGVLLPQELLGLTESNVYYASRLRAVCDFAAIDLRSATEENIESILEKNEYYIKSYPLRGVFCESNRAISAIARECGMTSIQIIEDAKSLEKPDEGGK